MAVIQNPTVSTSSPTASIRAGSTAAPSSATSSSQPTNDSLTSLGAEKTASSEKDQFLRLLVAQLTHQDPLTPQDGAAFIAQLAQFASLEQSAETNQRLADLQSSQAASLHAGYSNLVGRTISAHVEQIEVPPAAGEVFRAHLGGDAASTELAILDEQGNEIKTISLGKASKGDVDLDPAQLAELPPGKYHVEVRAKSADGATVDAELRAHALVQSVSFEGGQVQFRIGSLEINPGDIITIER